MLGWGLDGPMAREGVPHELEPLVFRAGHFGDGRGAGADLLELVRGKSGRTKLTLQLPHNLNPAGARDQKMHPDQVADLVSK